MAGRMANVSSILLPFMACMTRRAVGAGSFGLPALLPGGYRFFRRLALFPGERLIFASGRFTRPDDVPVFRAAFLCAAARGSPICTVFTHTTAGRPSRIFFQLLPSSVEP